MGTEHTETTDLRLFLWAETHVFARNPMDAFALLAEAGRGDVSRFELQEVTGDVTLYMPTPTGAPGVTKTVAEWGRQFGRRTVEID